MWGRSHRTVVLLSTPTPCAGLIPGFLRQVGVELFSTPDRRRALEWLDDRSADLLICELPPPEPGAVDLLQGMTSNRAGHEVPLIAIGDPEQRDPALADGATAFVRRPILQSEYFETARRFIPLPRRPSLRQIVNLRFLFRIGSRTGQVFSRDLSASGAFLKTDYTPEPGTRLSLEFCLPGDPRPLRTDALVRRSLPYAPDSDHCAGFAVEFFGLADKDLERLETFVRRQARRTTLFGLSR